MTIVHTIPDPPVPCTGAAAFEGKLPEKSALESTLVTELFPKTCLANPPCLCKRFCNKQKRRKRPHLIAKYGMQCFWCKVVLTPETLTIDHYIPLSRGGTNKIKNLRLSCHACNNARGNALPGEVKQ